MKRHTSAIELLDELARQGRLQCVGQVLPADRPLTWSQVERVRDELKLVLDQPDVTMDTISKALGEGYSRGTLSRFINLRSAEECDGQTEHHARTINAWLETIGRRREVKERRPHGFVETEVARRMLAVIGKVNELCTIGLILGDAGRGKSMTLEAAQLIHPGSVLLRVRQSSRRPRGLSQQIGEALGLRGLRVTSHAEERIIDTLRGTGRLLLIDEAHQLTPDAMELLRDIHDETGSPIVLAGTLRLHDSIADSDVYSGQMSSRVAIRYNLTEDMDAGGTGGPSLHSVDEIRRLYESDKVRLTSDGVELLARIANLPGLGGLRLCAKLVQVAAAARPDQGEPLDARLILKVLRSLHGRQHAIATVERAVVEAAAVA